MTTADIASRAILSNEEVAVLSAFARQMESGNVTLENAAALTGLDPLILRKLVRDRILTGSAPYRVAGVVGWCDLRQAREIATRLDAARRVAGDVGISATEAAEKYRFSRVSIYKWHADGWIREAGRAENGDLLLNESDVALARALVELTGHAEGKAVFPAKPKKR